ncbi:AAA family ATPase [Diaphorobacter caeni]|uniref:AAA family ATPase n=1 Tax=Diaphorobacter caeni TaxID=2784387 RepID=UPI00188E1CF1|nr:AAA family ATPase [Diaphorobacter caeni]MBF5004192.1 ATP-dependent Clp protease ATP-binding subunit [Diaphorobacter caeni]
MSSVLLPWQEDFRRECGIRRGVILHGNTGDLTSDPEAPGQWIALPTALKSLLGQRGYQHVVFWNRINGVSGIDARTWGELQSSVTPHAVRGSTSEGSAYDMGELPPTSVPSPASSGISASADDFLAVAAQWLRQPRAEKPVAFVLDWTQYLFGSANSLSENERGWLLRLGQATRDAAVVRNVENIGQPQSLLVLLCGGLNVLPPSLYLNNPLFGEIAIPLPTRQIRESAVLGLKEVFRLQPLLQQGGRELADFVDGLEGQSIRDIHNLARLSRQETEVSSALSLLNLYRHGRRHSPWEQLDHKKLQTIVETLGRRVKGQGEAIESVRRILVRAFTGLSGLQHSYRQRTPKGVLFFVGPTGVGKTELAKSIAEFLFGDEEACLRFDMSEFNHEHADQRLVGAPPGYVGYEAGGQLTNSVKKRPFSLLLFDEIEKAHPRILDKFLQILEDGRLTDGKGETVMFSDTVIVFTSNIGAAEVSYESQDVRNEFIQKVRHHFVHELKRPELLGRIGEANIIPFNFMRDDGFLIDIARAKLEPLRKGLKDKWGVSELRLVKEAEILALLIREVDRGAGGRGVPNALTNKLIDPLADFLFAQMATPDQIRGKAIEIHIAGGKLLFELE